MSTGLPDMDTWIAAVHASQNDFSPLGAAVVIDSGRVLTCAHVVVSEGTLRSPLWVAFPKAAGDASVRCKVGSVRHVYANQVKDLAVLVLENPVPAGVEPAPLRFPKGGSLVSQEWWAFGFPDGDPIGDSAAGLVGASLGYEWVRLETKSQYLIRRGFSGGGLWSPDYRAVVGIVGQAHANGDGRAITLHQANLDLRDEKLQALELWQAEAAGEDALAQWGWTLARDPEGVKHWRPRARGVSIDSERGWRFRGRAAALTRIVSWLARERPDRKVLVITGSPGTGKSAVLGRIVTTADGGMGAALPADDTAVRAPLGSVGCAVHAKGKTALEVATEIARAASARLPDEAEDLAPAIRDALSDRADGQASRRFSVVIDALDEAASPAQAREIIGSVVLPLAETCADTGVQVIVGTRRRDDGGDLLERFALALDLLDLDETGYFEEDDLAAYALACLQLTGDERPGNPYNDDGVARPLAAVIARTAGQNFLIAGLIARTHGLHDRVEADPATIDSTPTVHTALAGYLKRLAPVGGVPADRLLTALAFAEAPGMTADLWQLAAEALSETQVSVADLAQFARSSAANFLVEATADATAAYRLFHQALNDALLHERQARAASADDERALTRAFLARGRANGWDRAPGYLLRSLAGHARAAGMVDELLTDDAYLLHADLRRLLEVADDAVTPTAWHRASLLRLTPEAVAAAPAERAAMFSVTEALDGLGSNHHARLPVPYRARWAVAQARNERASFKGHQALVGSLCAVLVGARELLASASDDETVRLWDPRTGQHTILRGHQSEVNAVCAISVDGRELLASAGNDHTVRLWDPRTGQHAGTLHGHTDWVNAICAINVGNRALLASASDDHTVRLWDPRTGQQTATLYGHANWVNVVCAINVNGRELLASAGSDRTIRLWDPSTGEHATTFHGHTNWIRAVCAISVDGRELLASGSDDETLRLWDPRTGRHITLHGHTDWVKAVCAISVDGRVLLASAGDDRTVRLWDPRTGQHTATLYGHQGGINAVCAIGVGDRELLASGSDDETVRLWDPRTGGHTVLDGHEGEVNAVCAVSVNGRELLASASSDWTVRLWDPRTGQDTALRGHTDWVNAVCAITVDGRELLASASDDTTIRIWDPRTGRHATTLHGHQGRVNALCAIAVDGRELLASAGSDRTTRLWDPSTGEHTAFRGHTSWIRALCAITADGRELIASASDDETAPLWDPRTGNCVALVPTHRQVFAIAPVADALAMGLTSGVLVIELGQV